MSSEAKATRIIEILQNYSKLLEEKINKKGPVRGDYSGLDQQADDGFGILHED
jgi:hypothetical protein